MLLLAYGCRRIGMDMYMNLVYKNNFFTEPEKAWGPQYMIVSQSQNTALLTILISAQLGGQVDASLSKKT